MLSYLHILIQLRLVKVFLCLVSCNTGKRCALITNLHSKLREREKCTKPLETRFHLNFAAIFAQVSNGSLSGVWTARLKTLKCMFLWKRGAQRRSNYASKLFTCVRKCHNNPKFLLIATVHGCRRKWKRRGQLINGIFSRWFTFACRTGSLCWKLSSTSMLRCNPTWRSTVRTALCRLSLFPAFKGSSALPPYLHLRDLFL